MIDVFFAVYKRWNRVDEIMKQLKTQTNQYFKVNIWNNSGRELKIDFDKKRLFVFNSPKNIGTGDRWGLIEKTQGDPIICFDDDEDLASDFVEYYYQQNLKFGDKCVLGWYTKLFKGNSYKNEKEICLPYGKEVDYVGGGGSVRSREIFSVIPQLIKNDFYSKYNHADDLLHSYLARQNGYKLISIEPHCKLLPDIDSENKKYKQQKERAFQELREAGWKMLCEYENTCGGTS